MKPCAENRKPLVWLASGHCESAEAGRLRRHITLCPGCRSYFEEMSGLVGNLAPPEIPDILEPSESFHTNLAERVRLAPRHSVRDRLVALLASSRWNWRVILPALGAAAALVVAGAFLTRTPAPSATRPLVAAPSTVREDATANPAPTLASYRRAADRSLDDLDALLTREASFAGGSSAPLYTAATTSLLPKPN